MKVSFDNMYLEDNLTFIDIKERLKTSKTPIEIIESRGCKKIESRTINEENYIIEFDENDIIESIKIWSDYREFMDFPEKFDKIPDRQAARKWVERYLKKNIDKENIYLTQFHYDGVQLVVVVEFNK